MGEPRRERGAAGPPTTWWLHPFLVGAFPVVYLFAANLGQQVSLDPLWLPLAAVLGVAAGTLLVTLLVGAVTGIDRSRAALAASLLVGLGLTYGHAWNLVGETIGLHRYLLAAWAVLALIGLVAIVRVRRRTVQRATLAVTVATALLLATNAAPIVAFAARGAGDAAMPQASGPAGSAATSGTGRDVWYLVPDRYAGAAALRELYGFDNGPFLDALRARGFVVAERATANYLKTAMSLTSSLNMEELDLDALTGEAAAGDDWAPLYRRLQDSHAVERFLRERGYRYVHLGSRRGPTSTNAAADDVYLLGSTTEFDAVLVDTTVLAALDAVVPDAGFTGSEDLLVDQTMFQFRILDQLADDPGRTFVFAHLLVPHPPYVFNADGSRVTAAERASRTAEQQYLEQLRFTNARLLELVDRLRSGDPATWPIVVIAADEGPFPRRYAIDEWNFPWLEATPDELLAKYSILTAIGIPGVDRARLEAAGFHDGLTPVNLFRVVFNAAFGADLEMLPERNWAFPTQRTLYEQVDVTNRVRSAVEEAAR